MRMFGCWSGRGEEGNLFLVLRNVNHGKMTDSRLRINRDVETEKAVQSQVWSWSIKIWSYGGGENTKQQLLAVPARETRCWDSHISLGPVTWPTDTPRVRAPTRILSVNTPSLYLSPTTGDEHPDGDISLAVIFLPPGLTSLLSARALTMGGGGSGHKKTTQFVSRSSPGPEDWLLSHSVASGQTSQQMATPTPT